MDDGRLNGFPGRPGFVRYHQRGDRLPGIDVSRAVWPAISNHMPALPREVTVPALLLALMPQPDRWDCTL
jgi:hypothetical protein